jgi:predicted nucleotidyltransferase
MQPVPHYRFLDALSALPCVEAIYLFGSRARGDHSERSDIDLAIVCPTASDSEWQKILDIIENADTLLKIDCIRMDRVREPALQAAIHRDKKRLYAKEP